VVRRLDPAETDPLSLRMPATPASLKPIRTAIRRWLARVHADRGDTADVVAAVGEACANVIEHAYGPGGGTVTVQLRIERPDIVAVIDDTGRWRARRGRDGGRGLILMQALTDDVQIERTQTGTRVVIRRTIAEGGSR
jgi:anti-sigma regulatory factor (Ser/Thr protein kinase)